MCQPYLESATELSDSYDDGLNNGLNDGLYSGSFGLLLVQGEV